MDSLICFADCGQGEWDWCVSGDLCFTNFTFFSIYFVNFFPIRFFYTHDIYPRRFLIHKINVLQLFSIHLFVLIFIFFVYFFFTNVIHPHAQPTTSTHYPWHLATLHGDKSGMFLKRGYSSIKDWQRSHDENAKPPSFSIKLHSFYIILASFQNLVHSTSLRR